ncbi:unnamed protein product [Euphydryas editha]|uniref:Transposase n=1 Tax=Euphydryas editha TaxID=104508 RepID=A0AAU9V3F0_EUPED|nr:unnamed protein product [Euphydryas editha]
MLTAVQKQARVDTCKEFLELCGKDSASVFEKIVTDSPKKFKVTPSAGKIMATVFWDFKGILLIEYTKKGETINAEKYSTTLRHLREAIKEKSKGKLAKKVLLLYDNAPVHTVRLSKAAVREYGFEEINHPPYSPDLAPSDYFYSQMYKQISGESNFLTIMSSSLL